MQRHQREWLRAQRMPAVRRTRLRVRAADGRTLFEWGLPRFGLVHGLGVLIGGLVLAVLGLLFDTAVFGSQAGAATGLGGSIHGTAVSYSEASHTARLRQLARQLQHTESELQRLNDVHLAIQEQLFAGPEVPVWFSLPLLSSKRSARAESDDSRRRAPFYSDTLADFALVLQNNQDFVQFYGGYLRGVPHRWPVIFGKRRINSPYGLRANPFRESGGSGRRKLHRGVDLKGKHGEAVVAAAEGVVLEARRSKYGYGNRVRIFHPSGYVTLYAHLSDINVKAEQYVKPGQRVGAVGSTGHSTGPHLHYEVHYEGRAIDPAEFIAED